MADRAIFPAKLTTMLIQENVPLAPLTTFQVGGPAKLFVEARTEDEVLEAVEYTRSNHLPLFVLGGGSNLVVADTGFPGLVLKIAVSGIEQKELRGRCEFIVGAGEDWDGFVAHTVTQVCAGLETLSGIPGTVGGTPVQNVGAYGVEVSKTIQSVRALDLRSMQVRELNNAECGFEYRSSLFNTSQQGRYIVLKVSYSLQPGGKPTVTYADLKKYFGEGSNSATLQAVRDAVREIRLSKAMLIVAGDEDCRSAGSFFKNPMVEADRFEQVMAAAAARGSSPPPKYPTDEGKVKIPAAWLVENAGFHKGYRRGAVGISSKHSLAIVNRGGATAVEIIALKEDIQRAVQEAFGIELQPEPVFVGFDGNSR